MPSRIAFVTPWYGADLTGGAEQQAWQLSQGFANRGHQVEVLTTCARSFQKDWGTDHHPAGIQVQGRLTVRRFPVDARSSDAFEHAKAVLLGVPPQQLTPGVAPASAEVCEGFEAHNINSTALIEHLAKEKSAYDAVIFLPYLYGTTLRGALAVADRAYLQPLLHDEPYAYLPQVERVAHAVRGHLLNSDGEALLSRRLWGPGVSEKSRIVGQWVDPPSEGNGTTRIGAFDAAGERYVLYLGRRDESKNVGFVLRAFREYRSAHGVTDLKLVLAGPGATPLSDPAAGIIDLGFVGDVQKQALLKHALALVQPSYNESFSRAVWEAWSYGRPVIVNSGCLSTTLAVERCDGGWIAGSRQQWIEMLKGADNAHPAFLERVGQRGFRYYATHATPESVLERYENALGLNREAESASRTPPIYVAERPTNLCRDSDLAEVMLCASLQRNGASIVPLGAGQSVREHDVLLFDVADDANVARAVEHSGPLLAMYDLDTPALETQHLLALSKATLVFATARTREPAETSTLERVRVLPLVADPSRWDIMPEQGLMGELAGTTRTILSVGPIGPDCKAEDAIAAFSFLVAMHCDARLIFVDGSPRGPQHAELEHFIERHGLAQRIKVESPTTLERLAAYYRSASLLLSLSQRDDAMSAFLDAMWFDVPILAYATPVARETLGTAGILINSLTDPACLGALLKELLRDERLRRTVVAAQRARRGTFDRRALDVYVEEVTAALAPSSIPETA